MRSIFALAAAAWFVAWAVFNADWFVLGFAILALALVDGSEVSRWGSRWADRDGSSD